MIGIEMRILKASGSFISKDGVLSREDCSETDTALCNVSELTLKKYSKIHQLCIEKLHHLIKTLR